MMAEQNSSSYDQFKSQQKINIFPLGGYPYSHPLYPRKCRSIDLPSKHLLLNLCFCTDKSHANQCRMWDDDYDEEDTSKNHSSVLRVTYIDEKFRLVALNEKCIFPPPKAGRRKSYADFINKCTFLDAPRDAIRMNICFGDDACHFQNCSITSKRYNFQNSLENKLGKYIKEL